MQPRDVCNAARVQAWVSYCLRAPCGLLLFDPPSWFLRHAPAGLATEGSDPETGVKTVRLPSTHIPASHTDLASPGKPQDVLLVALPQHVLIRDLQDLQAQVRAIWGRAKPAHGTAASCVCWWHNGVIQFAGIDAGSGTLAPGGQFGRMKKSLGLLFSRMRAEDGQAGRKRMFEQVASRAGGVDDDDTV